MLRIWWTSLAADDHLLILGSQLHFSSILNVVYLFPFSFWMKKAYPENKSENLHFSNSKHARRSTILQKIFFCRNHHVIIQTWLNFPDFQCHFCESLIWPCNTICAILSTTRRVLYRNICIFSCKINISDLWVTRKRAKITVQRS